MIHIDSDTEVLPVGKGVFLEVFLNGRGQWAWQKYFKGFYVFFPKRRGLWTLNGKGRCWENSIRGVIKMSGRCSLDGGKLYFVVFIFKTRLLKEYWLFLKTIKTLFSLLKGM